MAIGEWIEWNGGECPVADHRRIEARLCDGTIEKLNADSFDWEHLPDDAQSDIIAYRIVE